MTTSDLALVPRDTRDNKHNKRKRRHVDQTMCRRERVAYQAKRHHDAPDDEGDDD